MRLIIFDNTAHLRYFFHACATFVLKIFAALIRYIVVWYLGYGALNHLVFSHILSHLRLIGYVRCLSNAFVTDIATGTQGSRSLGGILNISLV